jgi:hypothetical protein
MIILLLKQWREERREWKRVEERKVDPKLTVCEDIAPVDIGMSIHPISPIVHTACDLSALSLSARSPWGSIQQRNHHSQAWSPEKPRRYTSHPFRYPTENYIYKTMTSQQLTVLNQVVQTIQHLYGIGPCTASTTYTSQNCKVQSLHHKCSMPLWATHACFGGSIITTYITYIYLRHAFSFDFHSFTIIFLFFVFVVNEGIALREGGICGRGLEGLEGVWSCLVVSIDRQFSFVLFPNHYNCHCLLYAQPSLPGPLLTASTTPPTSKTHNATGNFHIYNLLTKAVRPIFSDAKECLKVLASREMVISGSQAPHFMMPAHEHT